ncbi:GerAB/ArcD/ProY family transporter [Paenibacillus aestuarii]|uniref:GerAB/ArcD/ProY family transporter n=1 Tax=Paenibacillus aestuarii TaxID=516965 RepID=A0ABW0K459_9BACL|nr:GerAB/ArcD/ProY family transporter [Paenibacillus aestuarii]
MSSPEKKISLFQLFIMTLQSQIGIGVISLPYYLFNAAGNDAWISVIVAGFFVQINIWLIWLLYRRFPGQSFFEMLRITVGKYGAYGLKIAYSIYFFTIATLIVLLFVRLVNIWILPRTPMWLVTLIMIAVCVYGVVDHLRVMARFFFLASTMLIVLLFLIITVAKDINYLSILPIGNSGMLAILGGVHHAIISFLGYEVLLVILPHSLGGHAGKIKAALLANGIVTVFYTLLTFVCLAYLGPAVMRFVSEPVLYVMKYRTFHMIERTDLLFFSIWIVCVGTSFMTYLYLTASALNSLLSQVSRSTFVYVIAALLFMLSFFFPTDEHKVALFNKIATYMSYLFILVLPGVLLMIAMVRGRSGDDPV